jgi:hypothetical protein
MLFYRNEFRFDAAALEALLNPVRQTNWTDAKCLQLIDDPECWCRGRNTLSGVEAT